MGIETAITIASVLGPSLLFGGISIGISESMSLIKGATGRGVNPGQNVSMRQAAAARRIIYGQTRVGAIPTFIDLFPSDSGHPDQYLYVVFTICGHEINSLVATNFNGVTLGLNARSTSGLMPFVYQENSAHFGGQAWVDWKLGKPMEPAFPNLLYQCTRTSQPTLWTAAHRQDGCASVLVILSYNPTFFPNGLPNVTFDVQGKKVYDPRTGTSYYSASAALCILDFLTNKEYGLGADINTEINIASFITAANICDQQVPLKAGGSEYRYQCNGMFATDANPNDILKSMANSMAGFIGYSQGQWYAIAGAWTDSILALGDDDMRDVMEIQTLVPKRQLCNAVQGTFYAAALSYQQLNFPAVVHPQPICDDSGYPSATQRGLWTVGQTNNAGDCVIDGKNRSNMGIWAPGGTAYSVNDYVRTFAQGVFVCIAPNTSTAAGAISGGNEPGVGLSAATYWVDVTATYSEFRGGVYVCIQSTVAALVNEPGQGSLWRNYWVEANEYIWRDIDFNFTTSSSRAQRIACILLNRVRYQTSVILKCKLTAMQLQPGDVFKLSHPRFGWVGTAAKTFQVMQLDFVIDDSSGDPIIGVDIKAQEVRADIYLWNPAEQEQTLGQPSRPTIPLKPTTNTLVWPQYVEPIP